MAGPIWLAVLSHFLLDLPIHPRELALYPHSAAHLGLGLHQVDKATYWWVQLAVVAALTLVFVLGARQQRVPARWIAAACLVLFSLHLLMR